MDLPNLILARDLNFTWSTEEVWGSGCANDALSIFFHDLINCANMVDITPVILSLTCSNGQCSSAGISKRLDHFFMVESLCGALGHFHCCNYSLGF